MPRPKKGPRFGRDPAHQRLIMANLAAHLFEAGHIETTLPTRQGAPAVRRAPHHQGEARRRAPASPRDLADPRPDGHAQAVRRDRAALRRPQRRLPAHPEAGPAPRRQRAHGAHRTGVSQLSLDEPSPAPSDAHESPPAEAGRRVRRHRLPRVRRATRAAHGRGRDRRACCERVLQHDVQLTCAGRTDTGVHAWTQVVSCAVATARRSGSPATRGERPPRTRGRRAERRARRRRLRRPPLGEVAPVPLHDRQS